MKTGKTTGREHSSRGSSSSSKETNTHFAKRATGSQMMAAAVGEKHEVEVESSLLDKGVEEEDGGWWRVIKTRQ